MAQAKSSIQALRNIRLFCAFMLLLAPLSAGGVAYSQDGLMSELESVERQLQFPADRSKALIQRVEALEFRLFGTPRFGSIMDRLQAIKAAANQISAQAPAQLPANNQAYPNNPQSNFAGNFQSYPPGNSAGSSSGNSAGNFPGNSAGNSSGSSSGNFAGNSQSYPPGNSAGNFPGNFPGNSPAYPQTQSSGQGWLPANSNQNNAAAAANNSPASFNSHNSKINAGPGWLPASNSGPQQESIAAGSRPQTFPSTAGPANTGSAAQDNPPAAPNNPPAAPNNPPASAPNNPPDRAPNNLPASAQNNPPQDSPPAQANPVGSPMISKPLPVAGALVVRKNFEPDALPLLNAFPPNLVRMEPDDTALIARPDYYKEVHQASKGRAIRYKSMPVPVYIQAFPDKGFVNCVVRAFESWEIRTGGVVKFSQIDNPNQARIQVVWKHLGGAKDKSGCLLGAHTILKYTKHGNGSVSLLNVGAVPVPIYIPRMGPKYTVPPQVMEVNLDLINSKEQSVKYACLQNIVTHELGHALGLLGHSPNQADIMYPITDEHSRLSQRDINTLKKLYDQKCDLPL